MPDLSICFKEALSATSGAYVQGKLLFTVQVEQPSKNFQDKQHNRRDENRGIFFRQSENKDFPRSAAFQFSEKTETSSK